MTQELSGQGLILQLRYLPFFIMGGSSTELVPTAPERPGDDEGIAERRPQKDTREEITDLRDRWDERRHDGQAAIVAGGLVLFGLPEAARRISAASLARKAAAVMTRLIWRCQPCQDRASQ